MLQWFEVTQKTIEKRSADFHAAGYGGVWVPPQTRSEDSTSVGYNVYDRFDLGSTQSPVIPVVVGDPLRAGMVWRALFDDGVFTHPIVPPAVPEHSCRIRVSMSAEHTDAQVDRVLNAFERVSHMVARREPSAAAIAT